MRVTCPSCHAVYEAPDAEIGAGGRIVECGACGARWMQPGGPAERAGDGARSAMPGLAAAAESLAALHGSVPRTEEEEAVETGEAWPAAEMRRFRPEPEPEPETQDAAEPAERDAEPEALDAEPDGPEPDETPARPAPEPDPGAAAWRNPPTVAGPTPDAPPEPIAPAGRAADVPPPPEPPEAAATRRRNRVASIDAQSLSAELRGAVYDEDETTPRRSGGGAPFALGFVLALLASGLGAAAYLQPTLIGDAFPGAYPWLDRWAGVVDQGRAVVDGAVAALADLAAPLIDRIR